MPLVIKALFFDGDQTLWDFEKLMRRALQATLDELRSLRPGAVRDWLDVDALIADREHVAAELHGRETNLERLRLAAFRHTLARLQLRDDGLAEQLNAHYLVRRFDSVELYPDVLATLTSLRSSYLLGLLSNGNGYPERSGLAGMFSTVVFSQDHGVEKPDTELFDIAAAAARCSPDQIAMVGDSLINDVAGAQRAGWLGIWLNRANAPCPDEPVPDAHLTSLAELPTALDQLTGGAQSPTPSSADG